MIVLKGLMNQAPRLPVPEPRLDVSGLVGFTLDEIERAVIIETLKANGWRQEATAFALGIHERTIRNKIRIYRSQGFHIPTFYVRAKSQEAA